MTKKEKTYKLEVLDLPVCGQVFSESLTIDDAYTLIESKLQPRSCGHQSTQVRLPRDMRQLSGIIYTFYRVEGRSSNHLVTISGLAINSYVTTMLLSWRLGSHTITSAQKLVDVLDKICSS